MTTNINNFDQIVSSAKEKAKKNKPKAALLNPKHSDVFNAFSKAIADGLIDPVIIGDKAEIEKIAKEIKFELSGIDLIDNEGSSSVLKATQMAEDGDIDLIIKGTGPTDIFVQYLFNSEHFHKKGRLACHIALVKPEQYEKAFILSDAEVIIQPDLKQKIGKVNNIIQFSHKIGMDEPLIAVLAAVEVVYPQMPVTTEGAVLGKMSDRKQFKGGYVDGPLSFDCAIDPEAAKSKGITNSKVAGNANAMLAPNIETAHGIYKAMALYGNAQVGGIIYGGNVPVALPSRSDSEESIYNSIALGVLAG